MPRALQLHTGELDLRAIARRNQRSLGAIDLHAKAGGVPGHRADRHRRDRSAFQATRERYEVRRRHPYGTATLERPLRGERLDDAGHLRELTDAPAEGVHRMARLNGKSVRAIR